MKFNKIHETQFAIKIGNRIENATETVSWAYEEESIKGRFDFGNEEENKRYLKRFETGELLSVCVQVSVKWNGFEGTDYLGACHIRNSAIDSDIESTIQDHGMLQIARDNLKAEILAGIEKIKPLIGESIDLEYGVTKL